MVDKIKRAILVVDMLNDFVTGSLKCERADNIIPNLKKLLRAARAQNIPIMYLNDAHLPSDHELRMLGVTHAIKGTKGAEVIPEIKPTKKDYVIEKRTYSGFFETGLDILLRDLGVDTVIITGMHTHVCDRHTAADAYFRGYNIVVVSDAVEAFTQRDHEYGLEYLKTWYGARIAKVDEIIKEF